MTDNRLVLGIDFGTSGARAALLDAQHNLVALVEAAYSQQPQAWPLRWQKALSSLIGQLATPSRQRIGAVAINGTSGTVLLCDREGQPLSDPLFYYDDRAKDEADRLQSIAVAGSPVLSATSSLSKLLWWQTHLAENVWEKACYLMHQADWLAYLLHGQPGISDYHNALKLGYDVVELDYPSWMPESIRDKLPRVVSPGTAVAPIHPDAAEKFDLPVSCQIYAGTTDSIAAFIASGADQPGAAVTSLGSTLVLKLLSPTPLYDSRYGIYSHRLGDCWLVGGASNTGGAVLQKYFDSQALKVLSQQIDPHQPSGLDYYPLPQPGERFPINDPHLPPRLTPHPDSDVAFLHGLLEGIARIEQQGYALLTQLGAPAVRQVYTAGGGAQNSAWMTIRQGLLGCPVSQAAHTAAAVGTAKLVGRLEP